MLDLIVRQGLLVHPDRVRQADVGVSDGTIIEVAEEISQPARAEIQARGLHVFPGLIDVHVHFNEPGQEHWEGIATGSSALAAGGGTLFFDMPLNSLPCTLDSHQFDRKLAAMRASSVTDFALWGGLTPVNLERLPELAGRGVIGFKAFMSNSGLPEFPHVDDATLYQGMKVCAELGLPVATHAESDALTAAFAAQLQAEGRTTWRDYVDSRPVFAELEAIQRALLLAEETGCKLHIVHISSGRGMVLAAEAKARGVNVSLETCPHYLAFSDEDLERLGAIGKCAPPLRGAQERDLLWKQVLAGTVDIIGSDHSPSPPELKGLPRSPSRHALARRGRGGQGGEGESQGSNFFALWGGISGVQSTLAELLTDGWKERGLRLELIAGMLADNPAKRFGLARKGRLEVGYDADFALVDLSQNFILKRQDLLYRHKQSPYIGKPFTGAVKSTFVRGQKVWDDGRITRPDTHHLRPVMPTLHG